MDKPWTVLLLYPTWAWETDDPDVYINHATAPNEKAAAHDVMKMAEAANNGVYNHGDFHVIAIIEGHIEAYMIANDFR